MCVCDLNFRSTNLRVKSVTYGLVFAVTKDLEKSAGIFHLKLAKVYNYFHESKKKILREQFYERNFYLTDEKSFIKCGKT